MFYDASPSANASLVPVASGRAYLIDSPPTNALVTSQVVLSIALPAVIEGKEP